jgi:hypothetical protein
MYWYVLSVAERWTLVERRHNHDGDFSLWEVKLGVLNEFMVVPKHTNSGQLPRTVHVVQLVYTSMYLVCQSTYLYVPFSGYYFKAF